MDSKWEVFKEFIPLLPKLVWPIFIIIMLMAFKQETAELYAILKKRLTEGASIKIGGFLELGEQAAAIQIDKMPLNNIPIEAIGGPAAAVGKESFHVLEQLRRKLKTSPHQRVDTLRVDDSKVYSPTLLKDYVNTLGIRYIVFEQAGVFDGWVDSGVFLSQLRLLRPGASSDELDRATLSYAELRREIGGISLESAEYSDSARQVLESMQDLHVENLPIVKKGRFLFFANRGEILSSLISSLIIEKGDQSLR
ncbi:MAG: hypothetical protein ACMUIA_02055 [bacterium]